MRDSKGNFRSPLHPIYMLKDYGDTLKPFKSWYHVKRDFMQPVNGGINIGAGFKSMANGKVGLGLLGILRGTTQILTTPLTWLIRMPLRSLITAFTGFPKVETSWKMQQEVKVGIQSLAALYQYNETVEERLNLQAKAQLETISPADKRKIELTLENSKLKHEQMLTEADESIEDVNKIAFNIVRKFNKAQIRQQPTGIDKNKVLSMEITKDQHTKKFELSNFQKGLSLFARNQSYLLLPGHANKSDLNTVETQRLLRAGQRALSG